MFLYHRKCVCNESTLEKMETSGCDITLSEWGGQPRWKGESGDGGRRTNAHMNIIHTLTATHT